MIARLIEEGHDLCELTRTPPRELSALLADSFDSLPGATVERVGDLLWPRAIRWRNMCRHVQQPDGRRSFGEKGQPEWVRERTIKRG